MSILTNADDNVVSLMDMAKDHPHTGVKGKAYHPVHVLCTGSCSTTD